MRLMDWGWALLVVLIWGVNFVVIHVGLVGVPPLLLGALRFLLVALPAVLLVPRPRIPWRWLLAYGLTISFGQFALLFSAMQVGMPAGIASLVLQAQMIFTLLFGALLLRERWQRHQPAALGVASLGLLLLACQQGSGGMTLAGFLLTLGAAASWGLGNIVTRRISQLGPINLLGLVVWGALIPPLPFLLASYWLEGPTLIVYALSHLSWRSLLAILYLALMATIVGYGLWGRLLQRYPVAEVAPLTLLVPVVGLVAARLLLDERLQGGQWLGIALVLCGLVINLFWPRWRLWLHRHG
ncbi:MAG: EamA family transporter [Aeromonadaceae bacterium]